MLIGITGSRGHGKSTAAEVLKGKFGFIEYSFAEPLKEICKYLFGLSDEQVYGDYNIKDTIDERLGLSPREILQKFGTDFGRQYMHVLFPTLKVPQGEFWLEKFRWWYDDMMNMKRIHELKVVIPDVRFLNEAKLIKDLGGVIIRVCRPKLKLEESNHVSETELTRIEHDYLVTSDEGIEEFRNKIKKLYKRIKNGK